jgi:hypothetical protein
MSTRRLPTVLGIALAFCIAGAGLFAHADNPAKIANAEVTGKAIVMSETKDGKTVKTYQISVTEAKDANGKMLSDLKGKVLTATGAKSSDLEKFKDKEVIVKGTITGSNLEETSVTEKPSLAPKK